MNRDEKVQLAEEIVNLQLQLGFGAASKRELDLLIFHHLTRAHQNRRKSNYELATLLKIPEGRVKSYRLASALKYESINPKAILSSICTRLTDGDQFAALVGEKVEISLEDPIEKREMENFVKAKGHFAEYAFNSEVLRISPIRLFEVIVENLENADVRFNEIIRENLDDNEACNRVLEGAPTLRQKLRRLRRENVNAKGLMPLVTAAAGLFGA